MTEDEKLDKKVEQEMLENTEELLRFLEGMVACVKNQPHTHILPSNRLAETLMKWAAFVACAADADAFRFLNLAVNLTRSSYLARDVAEKSGLSMSEHFVPQKAPN